MTQFANGTDAEIYDMGNPYTRSIRVNAPGGQR